MKNKINKNWERRIMPKPKPTPASSQLKPQTSQWFILNGCELQKPVIALFHEIYQLSNGEPCRECHCKNTCPAWKLRVGSNSTN